MILLLTSLANANNVEQIWKLDEEEKASAQFFNDSINRLAKLPGFKCQFEQVMLFSDGGGQRYSGDVAVLKPKRFRWQYQKPYEQLYIGNGDMIWHYEPDLLQAEKLNDLESVDPSVMQLLDGRIGVSDIKVIKEFFDRKQAVRRYQVSLHGGDPVWLSFSKQGDLIAIEREDLLGNRNRMSLSSCSYVAPSKNLFSFTPPEGVDVLDLRSQF